MLVRTEDGAVFTLPDAVANECETLQHEWPSSPGEAVPLPNVSAACLVHITKFYAERDRQRVASASVAAVAAWRELFFQLLPLDSLYRTMEAANFLGADEMLEAACDFVARLVRGKSPDEIRELFLLPRDMTDEERRLTREQWAWALK